MAHPFRTRLVLSHLSCACALGRTNAEVLAGVRAGSTAGMVPLEGDIPGRRILFGAVPGELPPVAESEFDMRANRLLLHAVRNMPLDGFLARHAPERVAVVLGASNTGIDEAHSSAAR